MPTGRAQKWNYHISVFIPDLNEMFVFTATDSRRGLSQIKANGTSTAHLTFRHNL
jgi:hypothetical protein